MLNRNTIKVGTRVTFYPIDGAAYSTEGNIISRHTLRGARHYMVSVSGAFGGGETQWFCRADDIISAEPTPGAWGVDAAIIHLTTAAL